MFKFLILTDTQNMAHFVINVVLIIPTSDIATKDFTARQNLQKKTQKRRVVVTL